MNIRRGYNLVLMKGRTLCFEVCLIRFCKFFHFFFEFFEKKKNDSPLCFPVFFTKKDTPRPHVFGKFVIPHVINVNNCSYAETF